MLFQVFAQVWWLNKIISLFLRPGERGETPVHTSLSSFRVPRSILMVYLRPILMGNKAKVLKFSATGGASSGPPSSAGSVAVLAGSLRSLIFLRAATPRRGCRNTLRIAGALLFESLHSAGLPLKLSCSQNGPVLEEIWGILVHPQTAGWCRKHACRKYCIHDTAPWLHLGTRHTLPIGNALPIASRHDVRVRLKPSWIQNGPVVEENTVCMWHPGDHGALSEYSDWCRKAAFDDIARRSSRARPV